jgi:hypothetical protein
MDAEMSGLNYSGTYAAPRLDLGQAFAEHASDMKEFAALQILPLFRTPKRAASFSALTRETLLQSADTRRAARAAYNRIVSGAKDKSFSCEEHGLEEAVDDVERALYMSDFDAEDAAVKTVARALKLKLEERVQAQIQDPTTNWASGNSALYTDVSAAPWDTAGSDAIGHVIDATEKVRQNTGMMPNALILAASQAKNLLKNTGIKNQFPGAPLITLEMIRSALASIFGLEKLIVCGAVKNSAKEGQAFTSADVWNDDYALVARVAGDGDSLTTPCIGRTFLWTEDSASDAVVEQYREEQTRGDVIRVRHHIDEVVIDPYFGHLLKID